MIFIVFFWMIFIVFISFLIDFYIMSCLALAFDWLFVYFGDSLKGLWNIWVGEFDSVPLGFVEIGVFEKSWIEVALVDGCELQVGEGLKLSLNYAFTGQLG